jgi:hypothetical protein
MKQPLKNNLAVGQNLDSILAAAIGFFIIHIFSKHGGIGISPDSVTYISAARSMLGGKGMIEFDNMPMVDFPAFYPIFLAGISWITRVDPMVYGPYVNGVLFAGVIYLSGGIMNGFLFPSRWYKRMVLSCLVLSPCLLEIYSMLWSETLFILLLMLFFIFAKLFLDRPSMLNLGLLAIFAGLSCVTRYAGVTLLATGGLLIIFNRRIAVYQRVKQAAMFGIVSVSFLAINLARNTLVSGTYTGARQKGITPFHQNLRYFGEVLSDWLTVPKGSAIIPVLLTITCFLLLAVAFARLNFHYDAYRSYESVSSLFSLVYISFMLMTATVSRYEQFTSRLLSPLFIPVIWGCTALIPSFTATKRRGWIIAAVSLFFLVFQYNQWQQNNETYDGVRDSGIPGYTEDPWPHSPLVAYINANKNLFRPGYGIYSNAPDFVYLYSGLHIYLIPQKVFPSEAQKFHTDSRHYVLWFNDIDNSDILSLDEIFQHRKMDTVMKFQDGAIYVTADSASRTPKPSPF